MADLSRRFGGINRLYGDNAVDWLDAARVAVAGIGGVGSWTAEALARSGVGTLRLIDLDNVAESNINRQVHALTDTLGLAKITAMAKRIEGINPRCRVEEVEDFVTADNVASLLPPDELDFVVDAVDDSRAKLAIILHCRAHALPLIMAGGAGGKSDPSLIRLGDLAHTQQDPLLSRLRARLRRKHGFSHDPAKKFGIEVVYSEEPLRRPISCPEAGPQGLSCAGYGSSMPMTACVGLFIAAQVIEHLLLRRA